MESDGEGRDVGGIDDVGEKIDFASEQASEGSNRKVGVSGTQSQAAGREGGWVRTQKAAWLYLCSLSQMSRTTTRQLNKG